MKPWQRELVPLPRLLFFPGARLAPAVNAPVPKEIVEP